MDNKRPIDSMRNRGGHAEIGTSEDGAIMSMENIGGRLIIIKERSVYEVLMADDIDPNRDNPNVPPSSQKLIIDLGTESEMFSRTFLTAQSLFKSAHLLPAIDIPSALWLTMELAQEIHVLDMETEEYIAAETKAAAEYEDRKNKRLDHAVPSIPDIKTRCKTIFQKADQAYQAQLALIRMFYPEFSLQSYYSQFTDFVDSKYGAQDPFTKFMRETLPFILLVRHIRNCLDHRRTETDIKDFELQPDLSIISPTIEVNYLESKLPRVSLTQFLPSVSENLVAIFENIVAFLASKNLKGNRILPGEIRVIPEARRRNKYIKFAYWSPIGEGGYYEQ